MAKKNQNDGDFAAYESSRSEKSASKAAKAQKKKKRRIVLFVFEILVLAAMLAVLWMVTRTEQVGHITIEDEEIVVNTDIPDAEVQEEYWNVALFGVDSTTGALTKNTRSDTMMIASINLTTKEVKLVSLYRDTYLNLGNGSYNKCNGAYAAGGPKQAMNMINTNYDLQVKDFVTVGFAGLIDTIDALGGIEMDVTEAEISHLNNYQICISEDLKRSYTPVTHSGLQKLDGMQATAYCRIRYTAGDDFRRTQRQRNVLMAVAEKAKGASVSDLTKIANNVFDEVYTSFDISEILALLEHASEYTIVADEGFPTSDYRGGGVIGSKGDCIVPTTLEDNVKLLHAFLFNEEDYVPSDEVKEYSKIIQEQTSQYLR